NFEVCKSIEGLVTTRLTDIHERRALLRICHAEHGTPSELAAMDNLKLGEALLLPGIEEAHGCTQRFRAFPRLTPHIRHRFKYRDMPIAWDKAFVFTANGKATGRIARTVTEFEAQLATIPG